MLQLESEGSLETKFPTWGTSTFFFSSGLQLIWWGPPTSRTNTQKRCPFHYMGVECKSRKSRDTWSNRQIWPCSTEWSMAKANRVLPREHTSHSKHLLPTIQEKTLHMDITRWSRPKSDWLYSFKDGEALYSQQKSPKYSTWVQSQKWQNDLCSFPKKTIQYHSSPSLCLNH